MRAVTAAALIACAALVAAAAPARAATPDEDLVRAREVFRRGEYAVAIPVLSSLLYPRPRLSQVDDLVEAHVLLAACAFETGDRATAGREFDEALYLQADLTLEPLLFSAAAVELFDERRAAIAERNRLEAEKRALALEREAYQRLLESMVVVEKRDFYVNFIPFGAGQFQNKQPVKGVVFATSQGVTGAVSAGIWLYLVGSYGLGGSVPVDDAATVRRLQQIEIGAGVACLGLMAWGMVDSLMNYKPSIARRPDESVLPPELRKKLPGPGPDQPPPSGSQPEEPRPQPPPSRPTGTTFHLGPTPLPGGAGLVMTWEF